MLNTENDNSCMKLNKKFSFLLSEIVWKIGWSFPPTWGVWQELVFLQIWIWPGDPVYDVTSCAGFRQHSEWSPGRLCCSWHAREQQPFGGNSWWRGDWPLSLTAGVPSSLLGSPPLGPRHSAVWSARGWPLLPDQHHPKQQTVCIIICFKWNQKKVLFYLS